MDDDKKVAAAIAAVNRYLEMEASEHARHLFRQGRPWDRYGGITSRVNIWGVSGRQNQMQVRMLMQLKAFNK